MGKKVPITSLVVDPSLILRNGLDQDAVARYRELFLSGKTKALIVQAGTMRVIDGHHRLEAAKAVGVSEVWVEEKDVDDKDLLAEAYRANRNHGVPLTRDERDRLIWRLYFECGWTQSQIAELVGLSQQGVSHILSVKATSTCEADKRLKLRDEHMPAVARLILGGASHEEVADRFGVARTTVTTRWNEYRDEVKAAYESGLLKREVAERFSLTVDEVDGILRQYDPEPLNFTPASGSLWAGFKIDEHFGLRHPGNLPAGLVRNILYYYTRPGDIILDPFAGGGVVLDVAADMVGRKAYGFDLDPRRPDIRRWDILAGPPPVPEEPDVIFCDPPYACMKEGEYMPHPSQLGDMTVEEFLEAMGRIFGYWKKGKLVLVMGCLRREGRFVALPHECAKRMEAAGWRIVDWLVNQLHRPSSENAVTVAMERKRRIPMRTHVDVIVGERD